MKFRWAVIAVFLLMLWPNGAAFAQSTLLGSELPPTSVTPADTAPDSSASRPQQGHLVLDDFLRHHPRLSHKLHRHPELLSDPKFERTHRDLEEFIARHPGSREQFEGAEKSQSGKNASAPAALASRPR